MSGLRRIPVLTSGTISTASGAGSYIAVNVDEYLSCTIKMISNAAVSQSILFEVSNDAVGDAYTGIWDGTSGNWKTLIVQRSNSTTSDSSPVINADLSYAWIANLGYRWFRVRCTAVTSGSTTWYIKPQYQPITFLPSATPAATITGGQGASGAATSGNPVRIATRGATANPAAVTNGQAVEVLSTVLGALVNKPYSIPELDWSYAPPASGITATTTAVTVKTAAGSGVRNYITAVQLTSDALATATEFAIRDGAGGTVLWRQKIGTSGIMGGLIVVFPSPLKSTTNTLLEIVTLTSSVTGSVYFNAQGYTAP